MLVPNANSARKLTTKKGTTTTTTATTRRRGALTPTRLVLPSLLLLIALTFAWQRSFLFAHRQDIILHLALFPQEQQLEQQHYQGQNQNRPNLSSPKPDGKKEVPLETSSSSNEKANDPNQPLLRPPQQQLRPQRQLQGPPLPTVRVSKRSRFNMKSPPQQQQQQQQQQQIPRNTKNDSCRPITDGNATGAYADCIKQQPSVTKPFRKEFHDGTLTISCVDVQYKAPLPKIHKLRENPVLMHDYEDAKLVVGVMSSPDSRSRRDSIRATWGTQLQNRIYFVISGEWDKLRDEWKQHHDIIWLDHPEKYEDLTYKTAVLMHVISQHAVGGYHRILKTDDDIYWNIHELTQLFSRGGEAYHEHYYGNCILGRNFPYRPYQKDKIPEYIQKFIIDKVAYPERCFPPYCFGWGYAVSPQFADCILHEIGTIRYLQFEDVWIGLLAERCGFRVKTLEEENRWAYGWTEATWETNMTGKIMQHPVRTRADMQARHNTVTQFSSE